MDLNNRYFWDMEKAKIKSQVFCSPVKRKRKYSCSLDLFTGSACESVDGITESPGNSNSISSVSSYPVEELKEQDLISCLMKSYRSYVYNTFCSDVDCTLSLGIPYTLPTPDEQRCMDMFKKTSMEEVMEVMKSTLFPPKIKCSEIESSPVLFGGLYNMSSSCCWSTATYAASTLNPICGSMLGDSKDIQAHTNNVTPLASEQGLDNKLKNADTNKFENNDNRSPMDNITSDEATRWCSTCHTTATPLWRSGPMGPRSLCNACGIRYKKTQRYGASTVSVAAENNNQAPQPSQ